jgi:serine/threonine protein kinase
MKEYDKITLLQAQNKKSVRITSIDEKYIIDSELGSGTFGRVKLARHRIFNFECAIKIVSLELIKDNPVPEFDEGGVGCTPESQSRAHHASNLDS